MGAVDVVVPAGMIGIGWHDGEAYPEEPRSLLGGCPVCCVGMVAVGGGGGCIVEGIVGAMVCSSAAWDVAEGWRW